MQTSGSRGNVRTLIKAACFTAITAVKDAVNKRRTARLCDETTSFLANRKVNPASHPPLFVVSTIDAGNLLSLFEIFSFRKRRIDSLILTKPHFHDWFTISFVEKEFELLVDFILFYFILWTGSWIVCNFFLRACIVRIIRNFDYKLS